MNRSAAEFAALPDHTPVLVGAAAVSQRESDPAVALEPVALMIESLRRAELDAGVAAGQLLRRAQRIAVPQGFWAYSDPARLIAEALDIPAAHTTLAQLGILQQTLLTQACNEIAEGVCDVALVVGGEARFRAVTAVRQGAEAAETPQRDVAPDQTLSPDHEFGPAMESERGLLFPVAAYALMENALRFSRGLGVSEQQRELAALGAAMSAVAADNVDAWQREPLTVADFAPDATGNRPLAFPYTKRHASQWTVDQAAGLIFCSAAVARELGVPPERWLFPWSAAESNAMLPLSQRAELHRCAGAALVGQRALELAELNIEDVELCDLYSCFPVAVQIQSLELGLKLPLSQPLSLTGGMSFAGGPLNNYVLQSTAKLAGLLRARPTARGLISCVSGILHKQGFALWSGMPSRQPFRWAELAAQTERATAAKPLRENASGDGRIAGYTVLEDKQAPASAVAICDLPDGARTVACCDQAEWLAKMKREEFCGRAVQLSAGGRFQPV